MKLKILLVEDDEYLRDMVQLKAQAEKIECLTVDSVAKAREALAAGNYTLVAIDIMLPGESGVEVAVHILKNHPGVQFFFVSAMNRGAFLEKHAQQIADWPQLAAAQYLMKPFSLDYFFSVIKKAAAKDPKPSFVKRIV